jgi:hypothetical protein
VKNLYDVACEGEAAEIMSPGHLFALEFVHGPQLAQSIRHREMLAAGYTATDHGFYMRMVRLSARIEGPGPGPVDLSRIVFDKLAIAVARDMEDAMDAYFARHLDL